jgi:phage N-6-adenine-methyltransferase
VQAAWLDVSACPQRGCEVNTALHFSSKTDDWATPQDLFDRLSAEFGPFAVDVCASEENAKCLNFISKDAVVIQEAGSAGCSPGLYAGDGLSATWHLFRRCWMNPPYGCHNGGIGAWVKKAYEESQKGCLVCCLLPARTDTKWFHDYCLPHGHIRFLRGRVKFGGAKHGAPFPSMVVVFRSGETK